MIKFKLGSLLSDMGYRQDDVVKATNISKNTLSNIVNNRTSGIQNENLEKIALFLNVDISELFEYYPAIISLSIDDDFKTSKLMNDPFSGSSPLADDRQICLSGITLHITKNSLEMSKIPLTIVPLKNNGSFGSENQYIALISSYNDSFVDSIMPDSLAYNDINGGLNTVLKDIPNTFLPDIKTIFQNFIVNDLIKNNSKEWSTLFPDKSKKITAIIGENASNKRFVI